MAVAALIVSIVAVLLSVASVWYTRRGLLIERDRRHEERSPKITAQFKNYLEGEDEFVHFTLVGPSDLDGAKITLADQVPPVLAEVDPPNATAWPAGTVKVAGVWREELTSGGTAWFRAECWTGEEQWTVTVRCEVPGAP